MRSSSQASSVSPPNGKLRGASSRLQVIPATQPDELLNDYKSPDDMFGDDGLLQQLTKAVVERALQGELTHHLGYEKHAPESKNSGNYRNGKSKKTIRSKRGQLQIDVPRDRNSEFEP